MRNYIKFSLFVLIGLLLVACSDNDAEESNELKVAYDTIPPSLDPHISTAFATMDIAAPVYEALVTMDENYEPQLMLAESYDVNDEGDVYTFHLREGVKFHNGDELKAEDVVASMDRWKEQSILAQANLSGANFQETDDYTVELELEEPQSLILSVLGNPMQFAGIMPKEVIEDASAEGVNEYVGTGPFEVVDWDPQHSLKLKKHEDYSPVDE